MLSRDRSPATEWEQEIVGDAAISPRPSMLSRRWSSPSRVGVDVSCAAIKGEAGRREGSAAGVALDAVNEGLRDLPQARSVPKR